MITTTAARYASWTCAEAGSPRWQVFAIGSGGAGAATNGEPSPTGWQASACPTGSGDPALWPCRARRIGLFSKPMKHFIRSNPESGYSITYLAALPVALSEGRCLRVPTSSHSTIAAHLVSKDHRQPRTYCRRVAEMPHPCLHRARLRDRDTINGAGQLGTVSGLPPRRGSCAHLLQSQPLCLLRREYTHGL